MGQEESRVHVSSRVHVGVGYTKKDAAQNLENVLRFYIDAKCRVVWYRINGSTDPRQLGVQQPDGTIVPVTLKQDGNTGLHSCEVNVAKE